MGPLCPADISPVNGGNPGFAPLDARLRGYDVLPCFRSSAGMAFLYWFVRLRERRPLCSLDSRVRGNDEFPWFGSSAGMTFLYWFVRLRGRRALCSLDSRVRGNDVPPWFRSSSGMTWFLGFMGMTCCLENRFKRRYELRVADRVLWC